MSRHFVFGWSGLEFRGVKLDAALFEVGLVLEHGSVGLSLRVLVFEVVVILVLRESPKEPRSGPS